MAKKWVYTLVLASSAGLVACGGSSSSSGPVGAVDVGVHPIFNPAAGSVPLFSDVTPRNAKDGAFQVADTSPPVTTALNTLTGASTTSPIDLEISSHLDPASLDARAFILRDPGDPTSVVPNPNQNVFLLELEYASGDPLRALGMGEPPTLPLALTAAVAAGVAPQDLQGRNQAMAVGHLVGLAMAPVYEASVVSLSGKDHLRISPLKPLEPNKRYVVVLTNGLRAANGEALKPSQAYRFLRDPTQPLPFKALEPLRALVSNFWEPTAEGYFAVTNQARAGLGLPAISKADIVLSYSFTTTNDERVLGYIAEPAAWFEDQLTSFLRSSAVSQALEAGAASDFAGLNAIANSVVAGFPSAALQQALNPIFQAPPPAGCAGLPSGKPSIQCTSVALSGAFAPLLPTPKARAVNARLADAKDVFQLVAQLNGLMSGPNSVKVVQGDITLPYYLQAPQSAADGSPIMMGSWQPDSALATALNTQFASLGLTIPQANPDDSRVLSHVFPFPKQSSEVRVPLLIMYPANDPRNGTTPMVIYQHGITTDRSSALTYGSALAEAAQVAVVAIDHPLHGVGPVSTEAKTALADALVNRIDSIDNKAEARDALLQGTFALGVVTELAVPCELSQNLDAENPTSVSQVQQQIATGGCEARLPGSARQMALALALENSVKNAGSTIAGLPQTDIERHFNFTSNAQGQPTPMVLAEQPSSNMQVGQLGSGSLYINLFNFTGSRDNSRQGVVDLMNLRASLANIDLDGNGQADFNSQVVSFVGHSLGTVTGAPFVAAVNRNQINFGPGSVKTQDDIVAANLHTQGAGIVRLLENSNWFGPLILGGLQAAGLQSGDAALESYFKVLQAVVDSVDPMNVADDLRKQAAGILLSTVVGDLTIPNNAYPEGKFHPSLGVQVLPAPLAGTDPFARLLGAVTTPTAAGTVSLAQGAYNSRYAGALHSAAVIPRVDEDVSPAEAAEILAYRLQVWQEMISQSAALIQSRGASFQVTNPDVLEAAQ